MNVNVSSTPRYTDPGTPYLVAVLLLTCILYASMAAGSARSELLWLLFAAADLGIVLRISQQHAFTQAIETRLQTQSTINPDLVLLIDRLTELGRTLHLPCGLMLISVVAPAAGAGFRLSGTAMNLLRENLLNISNTTVFQINDRTLAIADSREDVSRYLFKIGDEMLRRLAWLRTFNQELTVVQLLMGLSLNEANQLSPARMITEARMAISVANERYIGVVRGSGSMPATAEDEWKAA